MGCNADEAKELICAAVRETFEESGVLLAGTTDSVVADTTGDDWEADRAALEARELVFSDFLTRPGLVLRTDLLAVLGGWLTERKSGREGKRVSVRLDLGGRGSHKKKKQK